jgi:hypothetical protein
MFLPESIDLGQSEKYILSIRIKPDSFMFSISEPEAGQNYCLRETSFSMSDNLLANVQRIIFDYNFLTQEFKQTNVIFVSTRYDLIPANFFDVKEKEQLYNFSHTDKAEHVVSGIIEKQDIITLFNPDRDIFEFLSRNLWTPHFFHHSNLLANYYEDKNRVTGNAARMYLNFHDNLMDIICFTGPKLIHCLTYENEHALNQLYYILKLWEQCRFNQMEDYLFISGNPDKQLVKQLQEYIKNIDQLNGPSEIYLWNEDAQKAPLDLLSLSL